MSIKLRILSRSVNDYTHGYSLRVAINDFI